MKRIALTLTLAASLAAPGTAHADGPMVGPIKGGDGVVSADGTMRAVALYNGRRRTTFVITEASTGRVLRAWTLPGYWGTNQIAADGTADGFSADGRTLVVGGGTVRQAGHWWTRFAVVRTHRRAVEPLRLPGSFAFDAISPDGRTMYLLQYGRADYRVRAYDLQRDRLVPGEIADPTEEDESMTGSALARVWSADRRWAYTLYVDGDNKPFIHALDTERRAARCIDLDEVPAGIDVWSLTLRWQGGLLVAGSAFAADPQTFEVVPVPAAKPSPPVAEADDGREVWPLAAAGGLVAALLLGGLLLLRHHQQRLQGGIAAVGDPAAGGGLGPKRVEDL